MAEWLTMERHYERFRAPLLALRDYAAAVPGAVEYLRNSSALWCGTDPGVRVLLRCSRTSISAYPGSELASRYVRAR
jgi:hypothetical protein